MKKIKQELFLPAFFASKSAAEFVRESYLILKQNYSLTYEQVARRGEFANKSTPFGIINGRRKVNLNNFKKLAKGLRLQADLTASLKALVEYDLQIINDEELGKVKARMKSRFQKTRSKLKNSQTIDPKWPIVFAALGPPNKGRTIKEIVNQTGITNVEPIVNQLRSLEIVRLEGEKIFYDDATIELDKLGGNRAFKLFFQFALQQTRTQLQSFDSIEHQFFASAVSVKEEDLPVIAKRFGEILSEFAVDKQDDEGDSIALYQGAFMPLR